ncbi:glycoside hydrolase family 125 protein [Phycisphaera mikurensis]|uniref:Metal-independent alpha-mannosidase n=1 Tax=Phycisphaera mikurensis (strain NBRC 102666 / KCTC 22515 / FYK2301M01) TaxID=1142394 RepID=I0IBX8_PHYMF|nr:glycoside hydrolase family 125 protein [Phycisphaera mikurensis]MBB6442010.1 hypothetical protein [Phycisphaera mikurensis]BAM02766.1 hypothetical protein PSMK_06070 [Phycisphaera mikurensis NBRC 102666]
MTTRFDPTATPYRRPPAGERRVVCPAVEAAIQRVHAAAEPAVAAVFENALPMTLDTAVTLGEADGRPDAFVITGDIPAMWPRDAVASVWPLLPFIREDDAAHRVVEGVLNRVAACLRLDPYANAFYDFVNGVSDADRAHPRFGVHADDATAMGPGLHERKHELDTLAAFLRLSVGYHGAGGDPAAFGDGWLGALRRAVETIRAQQAGSDEEEADPAGPPYTFSRVTSRAIDTLVLRGRGQPARRCGLSKSPFRPSDDAAQLPFPVAANAMAAVGLLGVADLMGALRLDPALAADCRALGAEIHDAVLRHGVAEHPTAGRVFAYEVDGFGNAYFMDDANVPSLLALPYLGFCPPEDPLYRRTRALLWSPDNPYFVSGSAAAAIGGPHVGRSNLWPMSILIHALTAADPAEAEADLATLCSTHAGRFVMHETFHRDDATAFTRPWFCWPNALFAELVWRRFGGD